MNEEMERLWKGKALTDKEKTILQALADGECVKAYAISVGRHLQTIKNEIMVIHAKLSARNTTHAVAIALRRGLIK